MRASEFLRENKIKLSTDPNWYGAEVGDYRASSPVVNIPSAQLVGFEPDDKMSQPNSKANVEKIVDGLKQGAKLPPLLVRKYKNGYQVLDGHHRFWAYKLLGVKSIPAQIVPDSDIEELSEQIVDEMPLPADWDPSQFQRGTTFKQRLAYALERAKKLGTGSSRVATTIEYQGRPTVLKIAKNQKGLAQNSVEASILEDGYASQLGILIPLIDYDEANREPVWIHTEMATKANEKQLCSLLKCPSLNFLVNYATSITGKKRYLGLPQVYTDKLRDSGMSEDDIETCSEYANVLADLNSSFDVELGDFTRAVNWGIYNGKPVIIDVGFNSNVLNQYYR